MPSHEKGYPPPDRRHSFNIIWRWAFGVISPNAPKCLPRFSSYARCCMAVPSLPFKIWNSQNLSNMPFRRSYRSARSTYRPRFSRLRFTKKYASRSRFGTRGSTSFARLNQGTYNPYRAKPTVMSEKPFYNVLRGFNYDNSFTAAEEGDSIDIVCNTGFYHNIANGAIDTIRQWDYMKIKWMRLCFTIYNLDATMMGIEVCSLPIERLADADTDNPDGFDPTINTNEVFSARESQLHRISYTDQVMSKRYIKPLCFTPKWTGWSGSANTEAWTTQRLGWFRTGPLPASPTTDPLNIGFQGCIIGIRGIPDAKTVKIRHFVEFGCEFKGYRPSASSWIAGPEKRIGNLYHENKEGKLVKIAGEEKKTEKRLAPVDEEYWTQEDDDAVSITSDSGRRAIKQMKISKPTLPPPQVKRTDTTVRVPPH